MYGTLLTEAFNKLKEEHPEYSDTRSGEELSNIIEEIATNNGERDTYTGRTLRDKREEALRGDEVTLRLPIANALSRYLDYTDYTQYLTQKTKEAQTLKEKVLGFYSKHRAKSIATLALVVLSTVLLNLKGTEQQWMEWQNDHYVEVEFNQELHEMGTLKIRNATLLKDFRLLHPDCNTSFFSLNHKPLVWYGKGTDKKYQFFSERGDHPVTGKPLKPITRYMIKKYICP